MAFDLRKQAEPLSKSKVAKLPEALMKVRITPKGFAMQGVAVDWVKK